MASSYSRCKSAKIKKPEIIIPEDIVKKLESLPNAITGRKYCFQPWQDEVLRKYFPNKSVRSIGDVLKLSRHVIERRIKELEIKK